MTRPPIRFRLALDRFRTECSRIAPEAGELDNFDLNHLARWAEDPRAEAVWRKVQKLALGPFGTYDPLDAFIPNILLRRRAVELIPLYFKMINKYARRSSRCEQHARESEKRATFWRSIGQSNHKNALRRGSAHISPVWTEKTTPNPILRQSHQQKWVTEPKSIYAGD
jgi:hypothetical protein